MISHELMCPKNGVFYKIYKSGCPGKLMKHACTVYFFKITLTFTSDSRKMNDANISHFKMFRSTIQKAMQFQQHMKTCIHEHLVCWMLFFIEERS